MELAFESAFLFGSKLKAISGSHLVRTGDRMKDDGAVSLEMVREALPSTRGRQQLVNEVYERLKDDIAEFRIMPGQRYSEPQLATALGVSRTPLRLALHLLAHEGYLQRLDGHSSWQVQPLDIAHYDDLYDFRTSIELIAVQRLCDMKTAPDLSALVAFWMAPEDARCTDGKQVAAQDERFHLTLVELAGNREMARSFSQLTDRIRIIRRLDFIDERRIAAAFTEHAAILQSVIERDRERAETLIKTHIGASREAIQHITLQRLALASARRNAT
jgi:DNA-binding GntR family transcriptional regulator